MNESNGMALIVGTARAFEAEDAQRRAELDRWLAKEPDRDQTSGLCIHGHPLDGVKYDARRGATRRFCRTCHKLEQRRRRAA